MRNILSIMIVMIMSLSLVSVGCGQQQESQVASSQEAIDVAKTLATTQEKVDYLLEQGQAFFNSQEFQQAANLAQYVLQYLDKDSQAAQSLLEKAQKELTAKVEEAVGGVTKGLGGFGQ